MRASVNAKAKAQRANTNNNVALATQLLESWAWGALSATDVIRLAKAATQDGSQSIATQELGSLGHTSDLRRNHINNSQRDLSRVLSRRVTAYREFPAAVFQEVVLTGFKTGSACRQQVMPITPLHRVFAHLHANYPKVFERTWGNSEMACQFWSTLHPEDPNAAHWAMFLSQRCTAQVLVYAVHGDAVPVFKHKSLMVWSACCLLGDGSTKEMKSLWCSYWSHMRNKDLGDPAQDTELQIWKVITWDMRALATGLHPDRDWNEQLWPPGSQEALMAGKQLAQGFCAIPWLLRGDIDHNQKTLGLESPCGNNMCQWCPANRTNLQWTDCRATAPWKALCFSELPRRLWNATHSSRHPVFNTLHVSRCALSVDVQHVLALGTAQEATGSALWLLVFRLLPGSAKRNLAVVWEHISQYYREHKPPTTIRKLQMSMFHHPQVLIHLAIPRPRKPST